VRPGPLRPGCVLRASRSGNCGGVDERLLAEARQARERLSHAEQAAQAARAEFRGAVHRLVVHRSRSEDAAAALGLSHQQLNEMVQAAAGSAREDRAGTPAVDLACSFCGRSQHEVRKLIAGPGGYICDGCVGLTEGVVRAGHPTDTRLGPVHAVPEQDGLARCSFCGKYRCLVTGQPSGGVLKLAGVRDGDKGAHGIEVHAQ
jgi:hypothetical protein